jgi:hypothetical protein
MIKLKKVLESSARERLKKRVKDSRPQFELEPDKKYIDRITLLYKRNPEQLKRNYKNFVETYIEKDSKGDYLPGLIGMFNMISLVIGYTKIKLPVVMNVGSRVQVSLEMDKIVTKANVPREFDLKTAAYFLQVLEEKAGLKVEGI